MHQKRKWIKTEPEMAFGKQKVGWIMRTNKIIEAIHEGRLDERLTEIYADPYIIPYEKKRYEQALYQMPRSVRMK